MKKIELNFFKMVMTLLVYSRLIMIIINNIRIKNYLSFGGCVWIGKRIKKSLGACFFRPYRIEHCRIILIRIFSSNPSRI